VRFLGGEATRERLPFAALVAALRAMSDGERTVFKSVGSALEDLAAAMLVHRGAQVMQ